MAAALSSSSSSISIDGFTYDVFLSFVGASGTRHAFTDYLWKALNDKGIRTSMDDEKTLRWNEITPSLTLKQIKQSRMAIVVLSENYADSSFRLDELANIIDCIKEKGRLVLPVFYKVDPSDVRNLRGSFAKAMAKHEARFDRDIDRLPKWKKALHRVANLIGFPFKNDVMNRLPKWKKAMHQVTNLEGFSIDRGTKEFESFEMIVKEVSRNVNRALADYPMGPESRLEKISQVFQAETTCKLLGVVSSIVGLSCYAWSPSFNRLIGGWNPLKFFLYGVWSLVIIAAVLFAKPASFSIRHKNYICFVVFMIIVAYSFFYDGAVDGNPEMLSLVSNVAFALVSLSLSKLVKFGFETGTFCYFLGCFAIQLLHVDWKLIWVAIIVDCPLFLWHFSSDSRPVVDYRDQTIPVWTPDRGHIHSS